MTTVRFIGDVHGRFKAYKALIRAVPRSIQVGDMGVGFFKWPHGEAAQNPPHDAMVSGDHRFIRGNHDNPAVCRTQSQWIADGHIEDGMMFVGGGVSIDQALRHQSFDWWPEEELSPAELDAMIAR